MSRRPTLRSRKPVQALTLADFDRFPVWEYALEETVPDETWVRPTERFRIGRGLYSQLVRSSFWTARGQPIPGFMIVSTYDAAPDVTSGAVLEPSYLPLPALSRREAVRRHATWDLRVRRNLLRGLRRRDGTVFPIRYQLEVPVGRGAALTTGTIK